MESMKACVMSQSAASSFFVENNGSNGKGSEIISPKPLAPDFASIASQGQCSPSYAASGHLVYARRKPEVESSKSTGCGSQSVGTDCDPRKNSNDDQEALKCREDLKEPENKSPDVLSTSGKSCVGILAEKPSLSTSSSLPETKNILSPSAFTPLLTATNPLPVDKKTVNFNQLQERYCRLQDVLREFDLANQDEYIHILRSMSSVELSRLAVDLENRSIQLTYEEAKELQRACAFNVLESYPENK